MEQLVINNLKLNTGNGVTLKSLHPVNPVNLRLNSFSARVQPQDEFSEKSLCYRVYKYFLFILLATYIIYLVAELFNILSSDDQSSLSNDLIPGLTEALNSTANDPDNVNNEKDANNNSDNFDHQNKGNFNSRGSFGRKFDIIWCFSMLTIKGLTFIAVFWETIKLTYVSIGFTFISLVYNCIFQAILPAISDSFVIICLGFFAWKTQSEAKNSLDFK
ncbi:uncharacterized protein LOC128393249 [Panonychus citri]|uniref:uncharacterized protein LOC128393249 n=1 Tax=Panonychus citri TaxID=50023 RepID=UPI002307FE78|nr:uncharacterized protein LOC128393249 [Panonychus citri]